MKKHGFFIMLIGIVALGTDTQIIIFAPIINILIAFISVIAIMWGLWAWLDDMSNSEPMM